METINQYINLDYFWAANEPNIEYIMQYLENFTDDHYACYLENSELPRIKLLQIRTHLDMILKNLLLPSQFLVAPEDEVEYYESNISL